VNLIALLFVVSLSIAVPARALAQEAQPAPTTLTADLHAELARVDARLRELEAERAQSGIGLPIALTAGSFAVGVGFGLATLGYTLVTEANANEAHDHVSADELRTRRWLGAVSLVGLSAGVVSVTWLGRRLRARHALEPERRALTHKKHELESALGLSAAPGAVGLVLRATF
jgi:hypothetical protein